MKTNEEKSTQPKNTPRELGACPICGGYVEQKDTARTGKCKICGKEHKSYYYCENDCDFCDICYGTFAFSNINYIRATKSKNPVDILNRIMADEGFGLRGCVHCVATPLSLILAYKNIVGINHASPDLLINLFKTEVERTPISLCKENETCGIPVSCGNSMANLLPVLDSKYENSTVGKRLKAAAFDAVESSFTKNACCKKIAYLEILALADFIDRYLRIKYEMPDVIRCSFSENNPFCEKENCVFFSGKKV